MLAKIEGVQIHGTVGIDGHPFDFRTPKNWAALVARPGFEQKAAEWLKNWHLPAYWPCYVKSVNTGRKTVSGKAGRRPQYMPIMPGYVFIALAVGSQANPWALAHHVPGIIGYLRDGTGEPATMSDDDILVIRTIEGRLNLPFDPKTAHRFKVGDKVRFADDLLGRWPNGVISRLAEDGRIVVDVALLGRIVPISVYPHQIEPV